MNKKCTRCKVTQSTESFFKDSTRHDGLGNWCHGCRREYESGYRKTEVSKRIHRKKQAQFISKHPERHTIYRKARTVSLKPECERCKASDKRLVRHHPDYARPLDVITVCDKCHRAIHKELANANQTNDK